jgi:dipeptidyl aminopeptidase/acylaminoacyl peptidase
LDSLKAKLNNALTNGVATLEFPKETKPTPLKKEDEIEEGTELVLKNLNTGKEQTISLVQEYLFSKNGNVLVVETTRRNNSKAKSLVLSYRLKQIMLADTLQKDFKDAKQFTFAENGEKLAFLVSQDTSKNEFKNYKLVQCHYSPSLKDQIGGFKIETIKLGKKEEESNWRINDNSPLSFSKSGNRLFFGTSPKLPIKDTTLPEFERVSVDVWNYKDEDLMTVQLKQLDAKLKRGFTAMYDNEKGMTVQLGNDNFRIVRTTQEGDGKYFYTESDSGYRVAAQWQGFTYKDVFVVNSSTNETKKIATKLRANVYPSYTGKYLLMYDEEKKQYSCYNAETNSTTQVAKDIPFPLYDEENDMPDAPNNYGIVKWMEEDKYVLIYDRYDIWKVDPTGKEKSVAITNGRKDKIENRYVTVDNEERFIKEGQEMYFKILNENDKTVSYYILNDNYIPSYPNNENNPFSISNRPLKDTIKVRTFFIINNSSSLSNLVKSKKTRAFIVTKESFSSSANLFSSENNLFSGVLNLNGEFTHCEFLFKNSLTNLNPQQASYNWGTAELFKWKAYTGKQTEGIVYKPENFDPKKKYPMIVYFYERNNQTLHNYRSPAPTASALNIPYFVSNGYIVFVPDIWYTTGKPGKSAYDYIVSGTRALVKQGFVDSTKIGLQGQSWGGYQIAYLVTQTNLYKAAWAGAPVANMFSAYGGIRWGTGLNRQFQYEHSQSRIGATPWEKPNLYIENSPLFHLPKVKTPLVIMHNDADDAVPWYQGIELFTALRRLSKPVWMLNYNNEAHNLIERKNRKDIQQKQAEFFDYMLKNAAPAKWISEGIPAVMKGRVQ